MRLIGAASNTLSEPYILNAATILRNTRHMQGLLLANIGLCTAVLSEASGRGPTYSDQRHLEEPLWDRPLLL